MFRSASCSKSDIQKRVASLCCSCATITGETSLSYSSLVARPFSASVVLPPYLLQLLLQEIFEHDWCVSAGHKHFDQTDAVGDCKRGVVEERLKFALGADGMRLVLGAGAAGEEREQHGVVPVGDIVVLCVGAVDCGQRGKDFTHSDARFRIRHC